MENQQIEKLVTFLQAAGQRQRLLPAHPDFAEMRRLLVDWGFMTRSRGIYHKVEPQP